MRINEKKYLARYKELIGNEIPKLIGEFDFSENNGDFEFLTKSSAVYSSNIEGNSIDLNSYMNYEMNKDKFKVGKETKEIEDFYFASLIHLRFAHIHPFRDGNGRVARLLEKWFVTEKLGRDFWKIPSEEFYKKNQVKYYQTIELGVNFYVLNYDKCLDFFRNFTKLLR